MNAPSTFQRTMDSMLSTVPFLRAYLDVIVKFSETLEEHVEHVNNVLKILSRNQMKVKIRKCFFAQQSVALLGHIIDDSGVRVDPNRILAIKELPLSISKTEVRSFLGLAGRYRRFIRGFANISAPLHAATSATIPFLWTTEMNEHFHRLKTAMTTALVQAISYFDRQFIVETDASAVITGAVLAQNDENGPVHHIHFASRTMTKADRGYSACERKALAVVFALKKFPVYLLSDKKFVVLSDYKALKDAFQKLDIHGLIARWIDLLVEYNFAVEFLPGQEDGAADFLSRPFKGTNNQNVVSEDES